MPACLPVSSPSISGAAITGAQFTEGDQFQIKFILQLTGLLSQIWNTASSYSFTSTTQYASCQQAMQGILDIHSWESYKLEHRLDVCCIRVSDKGGHVIEWHIHEEVREAADITNEKNSPLTKTKWRYHLSSLGIIARPEKRINSSHSTHGLLLTNNFRLRKDIWNVITFALISYLGNVTTVSKHLHSQPTSSH